MGVGRDGSKKPAQLDAVLFQPAAIGLLTRDLALDLVVDHDPARFGIDQEHAARLKTAFLLNPFGRKLDHAHLAGEHHEAVGRDHVTAGPQAVAVQGAAHEPAVGEHHGGRAVPRFHDRGVILVERPLVGRNVVARPKSLGNHHHQGVRRGTAGANQQLHRVVEARRIAPARLKDRKQLRHVFAQRRSRPSSSRGPEAGWHCRAAC